MFPGSFFKMNVGLLLSMNQEMCVKKDACERLRRKKTKEAEQEQQEMKLIYLFHIQ